jgi:hypothetical protein
MFAPSSKPPPPPPPEVDPSEDRREITALINGLFSVVGVGFAAWWAAGNIHWRNETVGSSDLGVQWQLTSCIQRVLLALASSIIVAIAEGVLYAIWSSHSEKRKQTRQKKLKPKSHREAKPEQNERKAEPQDEAQVSMIHRKGYEYQNEEDFAGS